MVTEARVWFFRLDLDPFLGFDRLVQAFREPPPGHHPAGEFVDQDDFVVLDDIVAVEDVKRVGAQGLVGVVDQADIGRII